MIYQLTEETRSTLTLSRDNLSSTVRAKTSIVTTEPSQVATGSVGVVFLVAVMVVCLALDITAVCYFVKGGGAAATSGGSGSGTSFGSGFASLTILLKRIFGKILKNIELSTRIRLQKKIG